MQRPFHDKRSSAPLGLAGVSSSASDVADAVGALALDQPLDAGAGDDHVVVAGRAARSASSQNASRIARFTLLRCTALPIRRPTEIPSRGSSPASSSPRTNE